MVIKHFIGVDARTKPSVQWIPLATNRRLKRWHVGGVSSRLIGWRMVLQKFETPFKYHAIYSAGSYYFHQSDFNNSGQSASNKQAVKKDTCGGFRLFGTPL